MRNFFSDVSGPRARDKPSLPAFLSGYPATEERRVKAQVGPKGALAFTAAEWRALRAMCGGK